MNDDAKRIENAAPLKAAEAAGTELRKALSETLERRVTQSSESNKHYLHALALLVAVVAASLGCLGAVQVSVLTIDTSGAC